MQREIEVVARNVELHANFFADGFRADDIHAKRGVKQCAQKRCWKFARRVRQRYLQAGA
ncbi:hypothetical protein J2794_003194 [Paraburkholderia terricola]|nr:hypothetical protein [Paraburkholderia terricola]